MVSGENFPGCLPVAIPVMMATMSSGTGVGVGVLSLSQYHRCCLGVFSPSSFTGPYFLRRWRRQRHRSRRNPSSPAMTKATTSDSQTPPAGKVMAKSRVWGWGLGAWGFFFCLWRKVNLSTLIRMLNHVEKSAGLAKMIGKFAWRQGSWVWIRGDFGFEVLFFFDSIFFMSTWKT